MIKVSAVTTTVMLGKAQNFGHQTFDDKIVGFHPVQSTTSSKPVMCSMLEGHSREVNAVTFSPDSKLVATGSYDGTARLWDTVTGAVRNRLVHSTYREVDGVAFSVLTRWKTGGIIW